MGYLEQYRDDAARLVADLDLEAIERIADRLVVLKARGRRLFLLGVGGNAADCLHAAADFSKLSGIEAYTPAGNIAEVTARTNDDGWSSTYRDYLRGCRLCSSDLVFVLSVGGGSVTTSRNILEAVVYAESRRVAVVGIVGPNGGTTWSRGSEVIRIASDTPLVHSIQSLILHALFNHPRLAV